MSFINWGEETPEQLRARKRMEDEMLFEQAAYNAAVAAAVAGGSRVVLGTLITSLNWADIAPDGGGPEGQDWMDFDEWTTPTFTTIHNVTGMSITCDIANAHVHSDLQYSDLRIDLYDASDDSWNTAWTHRLPNPGYPNDTSNDYPMSKVRVKFSNVSQLTKIRVVSNPGSDQTYHDWDDETLKFNFYR